MIRIINSRDLYEYDIRGLVMAFFPGEEMTYEVEEKAGQEKREEEEKENSDLFIYINWTETSVETVVGKEKETCTVPYGDRKGEKTAVKLSLYPALSRFTKKELPWGTLTGIRPTKIPMALLNEGKTEEEIIKELKEVYLISEEKSRLSLEIAEEEKKLLSKIDYENGYSLYIGIPFCPSTCLYCSFTSYPISMYKNRVDEYLDCLEKELSYTAEEFQNKKLNTIYIGGGTPTTLNAEQLDRLCTFIETHFDLSHLLEFTIEAGRPDSVTEDKLLAIKKHRVDRISINPQTMNQETLKVIGRHHTVEQVKEVFALARKHGFDNINMDLILGLPGESKEDVCYTMEEIKKLSPDNLTIHSLAIKRAARLNIERDLYKGYRMENSEDLMEFAESTAREMGMKPYYLYRQKNMAGNLENVGYARSGKAGLYNILIMEEVQTIAACGAGATTKAVFADNRIERAENVKDIKQYLERVDEMIERKKRLFKKENEK